MDLFDTSCVQGIAGWRFAEIAPRRDLAVSPITYYELLCHLDERDDDGSARETFRRRKGQLLKLRYFRVLDDPYAHHALSIGASDIVAPGRFEERLLLPGMLAALDASETLDDFYAKEITDQNGRLRLAKDSAEAARQELDRLEREFTKVMAETWEGLRSALEEKAEKEFSDDDLRRAIATFCVKIIHDHQEDGAAAGKPRFIERTANSLFPYYGYTVARALEYALDPKRVYDVNDVEDGVICLHLDLAKPDILVTNDEGTRRCLARALNTLVLAGDPVDAPRCRVLKPAEYFEEIDVR